VVIGPDVPTRDEHDAPLTDGAPRRIGKLRPGSLEDLAGLAEDLVSLVGARDEAWQVERPDDVRAAAFSDAAGAVRVVFVSSDADRPTSAVLLAGEGATSLRDPFSNERFAVTGGRVEVRLPPRGVRLLIVG